MTAPTRKNSTPKSEKELLDLLYWVAQTPTSESEIKNPGHHKKIFGNAIRHLDGDLNNAVEKSIRHAQFMSHMYSVKDESKMYEMACVSLAWHIGIEF